MRTMVCAMAMVLGLVAGICSMSAAAQAENGKPYEVTVAENNQMQSLRAMSFAVNDGKFEVSTNCWCYYYYRYYTPVVYYRPVVYYTYPCYYSCRYVWFYNGENDTKSNGLSGLRMEKSPEAGTPLAKLGIKAGDIILKIDGRSVKSAADLDKVTENSDLNVLRAGGSSIDGSALADLKF
ncbi:MAG: PDZ domain-containing protein [Thermoguttaceae bacterium]|nr:PDZ domain-containing protein [Thermoguttaceae bacterium]